LSAVKARMAQNGTMVTYLPVGDTPVWQPHILDSTRNLC
jgi:hypothetical protein